MSRKRLVMEALYGMFVTAGGQIQLSLEACDGGQKEATSGPGNVLSSTWSVTNGKITATSEVATVFLCAKVFTSGSVLCCLFSAYLSEDGKTKVNMFFTGPDYIQVTKLRIKASVLQTWSCLPSA